jgi:ribosome-associated toxin RatA of RatAB toxin-antitoxin module
MNIRTRCQGPVFWLLALHLTAVSAARSVAEAPELDPASWQRLASGEVLVEDLRTSESGGSVQVRALMHLEVETLWTYIASCDAVFEYVAGMRECELLEVHNEPGADVSKVRQVVDRGWLIPRMEYTIEVRREPYTRVDFRLLEGNLKAIQGEWRFTELEEGAGLLVTHAIQVQPSFPVPRWMIRRNMRRDLPAMLACLRGLTGGSGDLPQDADLARCPAR